MPPVQITYVLDRDWTRTPDPTGEDRWACPISPTRPWRTVQKYNHMSTYYTPTSRNLKTKKRVYATTQTMQQQTESLRHRRYMKDKCCLLLSFVYFLCVVYFCIIWRWDLARLVSFISWGTSRQGVKTASSGLPGSIKCFDYLFEKVCLRRPIWSKQRGRCNKHPTIQHARCLLSEINDKLTVVLSVPIL